MNLIHSFHANKAKHSLRQESKLARLRLNPQRGAIAATQ
jgi:hypothetical protein